MSYKFLKVLKKLKLCGVDAWSLTPLILDEWREELTGSSRKRRFRS